MTDDRCIGQWTVETLRQHLKLMLEERRVQVDQRFKSLDEAQKKADILLTEYKAEANNYRSTFLPISTWETAHAAVANRQDEINLRLTKLESKIESRSGYFSISVFLSVASFLVALFVGVGTLIHWSHQ